MRVLVIEDCSAYVRLIEQALGSQFKVDWFSSLQAGIKAAQTKVYDLIILDLNVGDGQGCDTFTTAHAAAGDVPILVLSNTDDEVSAMQAVAKGAQDYICKNTLLNRSLGRAARFAIERRRVEAALRESERFANSVVNSLSKQIAILDECGVILSVNHAWKRFGDANGLSSTAHCIGTNYLQVCDTASGRFSEEASAASEGIRAVLRGETPEFLLEYPCHSPDEQRWFCLRATPFEGEGPRRAVLSHENITARKVAARLASEQISLREAVSGMEHVLGVVGHELRTPLAALRAISEYLVADGATDTAEANRFLREISNEVDRMSDTVNNLLEAARLNSGRARWNWSEVDVASAIEEAIASIEPLIDSTEVVLENHVRPDLCRMAGDADAIRRLILNLLSNARKHTRAGSIQVSAKCCSDEVGRWMEISVKDTGCGISSSVAARLGEAFALNSGVVGNNHVSGTGLGLAICKGVAAAHGGALRFESKPGEGTTVIVRLRVDLTAAATGDTVQEESIDGLIEELVP